MKFFIAHYKPLRQRHAHIIKQMELAGINDYTFILSKDKEELTAGEFSKFEEVSPSETSLFYKHVEIFKHSAASASSGEIVVVFEDDAILCQNFLQNLQKCLNELKTQKWDVLFAGECSNVHCSVDKHHMVKKMNKSRGTCLYVLNVGVGERLCEIFEKQPRIKSPVDIWLNEIKSTHNFAYYWSEPTLVKQGSENVFKSSLLDKHNVKKNRFSRNVKPPPLNMNINPFQMSTNANVFTFGIFKAKPNVSQRMSTNMKFL
jgi:glycosyl transferase family 25